MTSPSTTLPPASVDAGTVLIGDLGGPAAATPTGLPAEFGLAGFAATLDRITERAPQADREGASRWRRSSCGRIHTPQSDAALVRAGRAAFAATQPPPPTG